MRKKISQKDIADSLNISRVTVTKALQDNPEISKETIRRVKQKALEVGYIPDFIGRSLSSKRTLTIGVVIPKIAHSFFSYSIEKMYEAAHERGYNIIPMVSFEDREKEMENIRKLLSMRADGIILDIAQNTTDNSSFELAMKVGCKVIFFDRCPYNFTGGSVVTDDREGAYKLTRLLISKGYQKIFYLSGPIYLNICDERKKGYEQAMNENQMLCRLMNVDMNRESGYHAVMRMAKSNEMPDAIFAINDPVAMGIYDAAGELGLRIPQDIAVAGFGDIDASSMLQPPMTSVRPPIEEMAKASVEVLINMIENDLDEGNQMIFPSQLMERMSI